MKPHRLRSKVTAAYRRLLLLLLMVITHEVWLSAPTLPTLCGALYQPFDGRLSFGALDYVPVWKICPLGAVRSWNVAVLRSCRQASQRRNSIQLKAVEFLMDGRPGKAVLLLEDLLTKTPRDATVTSDLSVAYLAQAQKTGDPEGFIRALAAAAEAVKLDRALPYAAFNRAILLDQLNLRESAIEAWAEYRKIDVVSGWSSEAKHHLAIFAGTSYWEEWEAEQRRIRALSEISPGLIRSTSIRFPQPVREYVEVQVLGAWADRIESGATLESAKLLGVAGLAADALREHTHDALLADSVDIIRHATPKNLNALARAHRLYRNAWMRYDALDFDGAAPLFMQAQEDLARVGSPFSLLAELYWGVCVYPKGDYAAAAQIFDRIVRDHLSRYPVISGYAYWMSGLLSANNGQFDESLTRYQRALDLFAVTKQYQNVAAIESLLANNFGKLGASRQAWKHVLAALAISDYILKRRWVVTILQQAAVLALSTENVNAALEFQSESVRVAQQVNNPLVIAESLVARSMGRQRLGDSGGAHKDLQEAQRWIVRVPENSSMRVLVMAQFEVARGKLLLEENPIEAVKVLTRAMALHSQRGARVMLTPIYLERGRAYLKLGRTDLAEKDFQFGIEDFERRRLGVPQESLRISYFEQSREIFDEMVTLLASKGADFYKSLEMAERARGRELLDAVALRKGARFGGVFLSADRLRSLPENFVLVEYSVLSGKLFTWVLHRRGLFFVQKEIKAVEVQEEVKAWIDAIRDQGGSAQAELQRAQSLYDLLLAPVRELLPPAATLVFMPDKALHDLPFAALVDRRSKRRLIEEHVIAVAPSAALVLDGLFEKEGYSGFGPINSYRVLAVGNPNFNRRWYPDLSPLSSAVEEVKRVAELFPSAQVLIGSRATHRLLAQGAVNSDIIHLATHAIANDEFPLLSQIILAPEPGSEEQGALLARDIDGLDLRRVSLVVLSACRTARSRISPGEGVSGLARPFLVKGVPIVIASLWDIPDSVGPSLFEVMYRRLRAGSSPVEALRQAQLALLRSKSPFLSRPASWAAYQAIMGDAKPRKFVLKSVYSSAE